MKRAVKRELYLEIAEKYEKYIELGVIKCDEKLPSVREAALREGVNPNTLQRAYSVLEEKGLIRTVPKKGVYVISGANERCESEANGAFRLAAISAKENHINREELLRIIEEVYKDDTD